MLTFGAKHPQDVDTYVVEFNLMTKDKSPLQLHANVVHKVTSSNLYNHQIWNFFCQYHLKKWLTLFLKTLS